MLLAVRPKSIPKTIRPENNSLLGRHHDHKRNHHFLMYDKDVAIAALLLEVGR
jgi:hypothetical protein